MRRSKRSTRRIAEQAAQQLRELLNPRGDDSSQVETHHAEFLYRRPAFSASLQSHLYFEMDGAGSAEYQAALVAQFERCLLTARDAGPAFSMLADEDRLPTMQWSIGPPARVCIDIYTTGGVKLWAFEHLVQWCFEQAVKGCEVSAPAPSVTPASPER